MNWLIGLVIFGIDRLLKYYFFNTSIINSGYIAGNAAIVIISILLIALLGIRFKIGGATKWYILIIVGGISNLIDIIWFGGVLDYIKLFNFELNFSDILITGGLVLLIIEIWKEKK